MILNGEEVKQKLLEGINLVADTVKPTLGPQAKTVILQGNPPVIINDGVTITKHISSDDPYVQMGIQLVQNLASKAQEGSGDGTTTACILAQALCQNMPVDDELKPHEFNLLIEFLKKEAIDYFDAISTKIENEDILNVATIAANNDAEMGKLIQEALNEVGRDGIVTVEESNNYQTNLVIREGMEITEGYLSHLMCNTDSGKVEFNDPLIFMSNIPFRNFKDIIPLLEYSSAKSKPLIIICKGMEGSALNNLIMNLINQTVQCAVVLAPNFGDAQIDELGDIKSLIGGRVFNHESKDDPASFTELDLGTCSKVIITKETTTFIGGDGETDERIKSLKGALEEMKGHDAARIKARIARLKGGVATIQVGASSSIEMREKKERLDDALNATKAALEEGIVVGGGMPFVNFANEFKEKIPHWFYQSLLQPCKQLHYNSGHHPVGIEEWKGETGFNALTDRVENLAMAGVYDPVKVTKNSFLAAMSIAQLFYTTEVAVLLEE